METFSLSISILSSTIQNPQLFDDVNNNNDNNNNHGFSEYDIESLSVHSVVNSKSTSFSSSSSQQDNKNGYKFIYTMFEDHDPSKGGENTEDLLSKSLSSDNDARVSTEIFYDLQYPIFKSTNDCFQFQTTNDELRSFLQSNPLHIYLCKVDSDEIRVLARALLQFDQLFEQEASASEMMHDKLSIKIVLPLEPTMDTGLGIYNANDNTVAVQIDLVKGEMENSDSFIQSSFEISSPSLSNEMKLSDPSIISSESKMNLSLLNSTPSRITSSSSESGKNKAWRLQISEFELAYSSSSSQLFHILLEIQSSTVNGLLAMSSTVYEVLPGLSSRPVDDVYVDLSAINFSKNTQFHVSFASALPLSSFQNSDLSMIDKIQEDDCYARATISLSNILPFIQSNQKGTVFDKKLSLILENGDRKVSVGWVRMNVVKLLDEQESDSSDSSGTQFGLEVFSVSPKPAKNSSQMQNLKENPVDDKTYAVQKSQKSSLLSQDDSVTPFKPNISNTKDVDATPNTLPSTSYSPFLQTPFTINSPIFQDSSIKSKEDVQLSQQQKHKYESTLQTSNSTSKLSKFEESVSKSSFTKATTTAKLPEIHEQYEEQYIELSKPSKIIDEEQEEEKISEHQNQAKPSEMKSSLIFDGKGKDKKPSFASLQSRQDVNIDISEEEKEKLTSKYQSYYEQLWIEKERERAVLVSILQSRYGDLEEKLKRAIASAEKQEREYINMQAEFKRDLEQKIIDMDSRLRRATDENDYQKKMYNEEIERKKLRIDELDKEVDSLRKRMKDSTVESMEVELLKLRTERDILVEKINRERDDYEFQLQSKDGQIMRLTQELEILRLGSKRNVSCLLCNYYYHYFCYISQSNAHNIS